MTDLARVFLGLGANLGDRQKNLDRALAYLQERLRVIKVSKIYETDFIGKAGQPRVLNLVCEVNTRLSPENLLKLAKGIEIKMGRKGSSGDSRIIDIDILLYGELAVNLPDLVIPHPRMAEREFVLVPLAEIAPDVVHPVSWKTIKQLREAIKEKQGVLPWEGR